MVRARRSRADRFGLVQGDREQAAGVHGQPGGRRRAAARPGRCACSACRTAAPTPPAVATRVAVRTPAPSWPEQKRAGNMQGELAEVAAELERERSGRVDDGHVPRPGHRGPTVLVVTTRAADLQVGVVARTAATGRCRPRCGGPAGPASRSGPGRAAQRLLGDRAAEAVAQRRLRGEVEERLADHLAPVGELPARGDRASTRSRITRPPGSARARASPAARSATPGAAGGATS